MKYEIQHDYRNIKFKYQSTIRVIMGACGGKQGGGAAPSGKAAAKGDGTVVTILPSGEIECIKTSVFRADQDALICPIFEILECSYGVKKNLPHDDKLKSVLLEFMSEVDESEIPENLQALRKSY